MPAINGAEADGLVYVAATQTPWPGGVAVYSSPEDSGFVLRGVAGTPATMGVTLSILPEGPSGVFDQGTRLRVDVGSGALFSRGALQVFSGQNAAAVQTPEGDWEIFQFQTAMLIAPGIYDLQGLLRGQTGTEHAMRRPLAAGAPFVLLDERLMTFPLSSGERGLMTRWRYGPAQRDIADQSYAEVERALGTVGLKPLSPVHIAGTRVDGDLHVRWIRRSRLAGDSWTDREVSLGEDMERYEVDILASESDEVKRALSTLTPSLTYTRADQIADFGSSPSRIRLRIYQTSSVAGRGFGREALL